MLFIVNTANKKPINFIYLKQIFIGVVFINILSEYSPMLDIFNSNSGKLVRFYYINYCEPQAIDEPPRQWNDFFYTTAQCWPLIGKMSGGSNSTKRTKPKQTKAHYQHSIKLNKPLLLITSGKHCTHLKQFNKIGKKFIYIYFDDI